MLAFPMLEEVHPFINYNSQLEIQTMQRIKNPYFTPYSSVTSSLGYCNICYNSYDLLDNKPLLICSQNHSICKECLKAIKSNLRCPFCREGINLNRIRLNKEAVQFISSKLNGVSHSKKKFLKTVQNDRLATDHTGNIDEFIDVTDLIDHQESELEARDLQIRTLKVLAMVQLFLFQFPVGIYPFGVGLLSNDMCLQNSMVHFPASIRDTFLIEGYIDCLVGFLYVYFTIFHSIQLLSYEGLVCFYIFLLFISEMKSIICLSIYNEMLSVGLFDSCDKSMKNFSIISLVLNVIEICLGLYLFVKYSRHLRD